MGYICMLVDGAYPLDIRVRKEAESLATTFQVLVVCPHKKGLAKKETINNVEVVRIGSNYTFTKKGVYDIIESVFNIHPLFYSGLKKVFNQYEIDYLHVHDLPLASTAYRFKNKVKKTVLDLHENYPEALKTWFLWRRNPIIKFKNFLFMNPKLWSKKERKYCEKYDNVICVVEEMKQKLIDNFNINPSKMLVISNKELTSFTNNFKEQVTINNQIENTFSITYIGGFGPHRGLDTAILAMRKITQAVPNAKLFLVGSGSKDAQNHLKTLVEEKQLEKNVLFLGYRPFKEVNAMMRASKMNIIPHKENEHTNNTVPHKLFQIMMSQSLLLVSSCKPLKRIVKKYDAGVVFQADDSNDFAQKVIEIHANFETYIPKIENAYNAVTKQGENWEQESEKLIKFYQNLR